MQRRKHAGLGPRCALLAGVVLVGASILLYQQAYATAPGYPGSIALPGIPPGPPLGCNNPSSDNSSWVSGFDILSTVHFRVDGKAAGTAIADADGAVIFLLAFEPGSVQVNTNPPVADRPGENTLTVVGTRTVKGRAETVGVVRHFTTPSTPNGRCTTTTTVPVSTPTTPPTSSKSTTTLLRTVTTRHPFYPTTLAKVTETPLVISPNKVIMETSLIAGVLGAALSVGALGALWGGNGREMVRDAPASTDGEGPAAPPAPPEPPAPPTTPEAPSSPAPPTPPEPTPPEPAAPSTPGGPPVTPTSAFSRPNGGAK